MLKKRIPDLTSNRTRERAQPTNYSIETALSHRMSALKQGVAKTGAAAYMPTREGGDEVHINTEKANNIARSLTTVYQMQYDCPIEVQIMRS